ncbi:MAG: hypothetical protein ACYTHK_14230 [Planctomycetota bacterium]|jgi:hypothetical protein
MKAGAVSLLLSAIALGLATYATTREAPRSTERTSQHSSRVTDLERQVADLQHELALLRKNRPDSPVAPVSVDPETGAPVEMPAEGDPALAAIVDDAVDRRTKQVLDEIKIKANKKPEIATFAKTLELTPEQREATERVVAAGQREVHRILDIPMADGTNPLEELVEIVARGMAQPGKDHGWGRWVAKVTSQKIPGTDETYVARVEAVKNRMRAEFQRTWTAAQYKEFTEWGVDPTEIAKVPGSPNEALMKRVFERAAELGATVPDRR